MPLLPLFRQRRRSFRRLEDDVLRALPQHLAPHRAQLLASGLDGEEVVAGELADLAGKTGRAVWEEDLGLAEATGIEQDLARRGMAGVVLIADAEVVVAQRNPAGLTAPARVDDLLPVGQQLGEGRAGARGVGLLKPRGVGVRADGDA